MDKYFPLRSWLDSKVNFPYLAKLNNGKLHPGLDLDCTDAWEARNGLPDVVAPLAGKVHRVGYDAKGWGRYVVLLGVDGRYYIMAHLDSVCVREGYQVPGCSKLGVMGTTGNSTGPHLHFEIRTVYGKSWSHQDPAAWLGLENRKGICRWL